MTQQAKAQIKSFGLKKQFSYNAKLMFAACDNLLFFESIRPRQPLLENAITRKVAKDADVLRYLGAFRHQLECEVPILFFDYEAFSPNCQQLGQRLYHGLLPRVEALLRPGDRIDRTKRLYGKTACSELAIVLLFGFADENLKIVCGLTQELMGNAEYLHETRLVTEKLVMRCKELGMKIPVGLGTTAVEE